MTQGEKYVFPRYHLNSLPGAKGSCNGLNPYSPTGSSGNPLRDDHLPRCRMPSHQPDTL